MIRDSIKIMIGRSSLLWRSLMEKIKIKSEIIKKALLIYEKTILYAKENNYEIDSKIIVGILKRLLELKKQNKDSEIIKEFKTSKINLNKYYKEYVSSYEKNIKQNSESI